MAEMLHLVDEVKAFAVIRQTRWPDRVRCPHCRSGAVAKNGHVKRQPARQKYLCRACGRCFDDLTGTALSRRRGAVGQWLLTLYLLGLNLSNRQIAEEVGLSERQAQEWTTVLRETLLAHQTIPVLTGEVERDEVYIVTGHKGQPAAVAAADRPARVRRRKGPAGRGTLASDKPPVFGMLARKRGASSSACCRTSASPPSSH